MADSRAITEYFSTDKFVTIAREEFDKLTQEIAENIRTKTSNSGNEVNSLGLPEETTGATAASLQTVVEHTSDGFEIAFVGRKGIKGIDDGYSPDEVQDEWPSFEAFWDAIEKWARAKESKYGLEFKSIDDYNVASHVWQYGTVLNQYGGGTEIMRDKLQPAIDRIDERITAVIDNSIYELLDEMIAI